MSKADMPLAASRQAAADTSVTLCGLTMPSPVIAASGAFGYGREMAEWYNLNCLGGISMKGTTQNARFGNPAPRIAECEGGLLNAVGLQNPGVHAVIEKELPYLRSLYSGVVLANVSGFSVDEYVYVAGLFDGCAGVDMLEINISCPNVKHGGMAFGTDAKSAATVVGAVRKAVKKPILIKLSPNVTDIAEIALACQAAGADGLVVANTLLGMRINPRTGSPLVSTGVSGFSGPAVKPVILRMVYQVCAAVSLPVVGVGGIASADDVLEYVSAGATAVQIASETLVNPFACRDVAAALPKVMACYGIESLDSIRGRTRGMH